MQSFTPICTIGDILNRTTATATATTTETKHVAWKRFSPEPLAVPHQRIIWALSSRLLVQALHFHLNSSKGLKSTQFQTLPFTGFICFVYISSSFSSSIYPCHTWEVKLNTSVALEERWAYFVRISPTPVFVYTNSSAARCFFLLKLSVALSTSCVC